MKLKFIILFTLLGGTFSSFGQIKVSGQLVDESDAAIPHGNVLAISLTDSTLIKGTIVENGNFEMDLKEECLLRISAVNYEQKWLKVDKSVHFGTITLKSNTLAEVEVVAHTLPFESKNGNVVVNVDKTIFASSVSPLEILSKSPGVIVNSNEIKVIGKGDALVYINNRLSTIETLSAMPVSQIKSIEIIKNPDASFEAEGNAVILVKTKELGLDGYQAKVLGHYTRAFYQLGYFDGSLNWKRNKLSLSASANINFGSTGVIRYDNMEIPNSTEPYKATSDYQEETKLVPATNYRAGIHYDITPNQHISAEYNGNFSLFELIVQTDIDQEYDNGENRFTNALGDAYSRWKTDIASLNYSLDTDTLGSHLFVGATYSAVFKGYDDQIYEAITINDATLNTETQSTGDNLNILTNGQIDYLRQFKNENQFKVGAKLSNANSLSELSLNTMAGDSSYNTIQNKLNYIENIAAAYINWNGTLPKGNYEVGIRTEITDANAFQGLAQEQYLDTNYFSFFPNAQISYPIGKKWTMTDQFNSKIERPRFQDITPYIYYINSFTAVRGNPNVQPSFTYSFEHSLNNAQMASSFKLGLNHTKGPRIFTVFVTDSLETDNTLQVVNFDQANEAYIEFGQGYEIKKITGFAMVNISVTKLEDANLHFEDLPLTPKVYAYLYARIPVKNWFNLDFVGDFQSSYFDGRRAMLPNGSINFTLSKSFLNHKCYLQLDLNDIFQFTKMRMNIIQNDNNYQTTVIQDNRFLRLTFSYKFGKLKQPAYDHFQINSNELNRAN